MRSAAQVLLPTFFLLEGFSERILASAASHTPKLEGLAKLDGRIWAQMPEGVTVPPDLSDAVVSCNHNVRAGLGCVAKLVDGRLMSVAAK